MKRSPMPNRKKPIKKVSDKKRKEINETGPFRKFYVTNQGLCDECQRNTASDCHEISSGEGRAAAVYLPNVWLALCRQCHDQLQGGPIEPQIATKFRAVLRDINACREGRVQFTMREIVAYMED